MQLSTPPATRVTAAEHAADVGRQASMAGKRSAPGARRIRPVTERIACWSARHAVIALVGWLVMVGGALLAGHVYGTQSQPQYDPGRSGVAERMLDRLHVVTPPSESVLIQSAASGSGHTYSADRAMRLATRDVVAALRALPGTAARIRSPLGAGGHQMIARGGRAALVTFQVAGRSDKA